MATNIAHTRQLLIWSVFWLGFGIGACLVRNLIVYRSLL